MKSPVAGSKAEQVMKLRLARAAGQRLNRIQTATKVAKPISAPVPASAQQQETTMKKAKKKPAKPAAKKRSRSEASANLKAAKAKTVKRLTAEAIAGNAKIEKRRKPTAAKTTVPAIEIATFMARPFGATPGTPGGASMAELVAEFGIEAHPMRAKIHYVRHKLGWDVEIKDGRYHATEPKAA